MTNLKYFLIFFITALSGELAAQIMDIKSNIANYQIEVKLDTKRKTIEGTEIVTFINTTKDAINEFQLHLYHNAYRTEKSTFCKEGKVRINPKDNGYTDILFFKILNSDSSALQLSFIQPDDNNISDQTVLLAKLPKPLKPNKSIKLHIGFITKLPAGGIGRSGFARGREYYFASQWFPKIGVYEEGKGWNCHQFHYWTDFYSDFGIYEVKVTLPKNYFIGATGYRENETDNGNNTITYTYRQENVHDFAWAASSDFVEIHQPFKHQYLPPIDIILLLQPEHIDRAPRYFSTVQKAFKFLGEMFGAYPYKNFTIIDPPFSMISQNKEYPMLGSVSSNYYELERDLILEKNIINNICHQYWYGLVANNEFEDAWLDEGISKYITGKIMELSYDKNHGFFRIADGVPLPGYPIITYDNFPVVTYTGEIEYSEASLSKDEYMSNPVTDPIHKFGWKYKDKKSYQIGSFSKPDLLLRTLENHIGSNKMCKLLQGFFDQYKFRHPSTSDFVKYTEQFIEKDSLLFFKQLLSGTDILDYAVTEITNTSIENKNRIDVILTRNGEIKLPVEIVIFLEDGSKLNDSWNGDEKWLKKSYSTNSKAVAILLDPNNKILLDANTANNSRMTAIKWSPVLKWVGQWLFWMQAFLQIISSIC